MPRRRQQPHPSVQQQFQGGPGSNDDDLLDRIDNEIENPEDEDDDDSQYDEPRSARNNQQDDPDPRDAQLAALQRQIENLQRSIPPAEPARQEPEVDEFDTVDWDSELFANPKDALKKYGNMVAKKVRSELTAEYTKDQSTQRFWKDFYKANKDLTEDHDLVESTMSKNLASLANLPVSDAITKLGALTRERIARYSNPGSKGRQRAFAEGAEPPSNNSRQREPQQQSGKTSTLSDFINLRRLKRTRGAAA